MHTTAYQSKEITDTQTTIHKNLDAIVTKHLNSSFKKPFNQHNLEAFAAANTFIKQQQKPVILDSFCGTAHSSVLLAKQHPNHTIIGVDKSKYRLAKAPEELHTLTNCLLLRTDIDDFWRLAAQDNWKLSKHYILYPNPWPKSTHIKRRVHGSAVFKDMLALGGHIELRSNWQIYVKEFSHALTLAGFNTEEKNIKPQGEFMTLFEKKYALSKHELWSCTANLG